MYKLNYNPHRRVESVWLESIGLYRQIYKTLVLSLFLVLGAFVLLPTVIADANATINIDFEYNWLPSSLTLDPDVADTSSSATHGNILFSEIIPTSRGVGVSSAADGNVGTLKIIKKTIGVETTGKYYAVYLSTNSTSNALNYSGDSLVNIPAIDASSSSPSVFSASAWGYAVPDNSASAFASTSLYSSNVNEALTYATGGNTYKTATWASVPVQTNAEQIWSATTSNVFGFGGENGDTHNTFDIYYGLIADDTLIAGTYSNTIVYTALASTASLDTVNTNLARSKSFGTGGETETLIFDLAESVDGNTLTTSDLEIYLVNHNDMVTAGYDVSLLPSQTKRCNIIEISTGSQTSLTCTIPTDTELADNTADSSTATGRTGRYDFWVKVKPYNLNYVSKISSGNNSASATLAETTTEAFAYVGLQSRYKAYENGNATTKPYVTKMQEMTTPICNNTNKWNNQTGSSARIYDNADTTALLAAGTDTLGISTFALTDTRDNKDYLVRRLADGNCWMVQNLDLDLASFAGTRNLTKDNTDLNSKDYWNPSASAFEIAEGIDSSVTQSNYFEVYSQNVMNNRERYQFQSEDVYGTVEGLLYTWGKTIDGDVALAGDVAIPRSYSNGLKYLSGNEVDSSNYPDASLSRDSVRNSARHGSKYIGSYYNFYAATAEGTSTPIIADEVSEDSICPYGWKLSSAIDGKAFASLVEVYSLYGDDQAYVEPLQKIPLSFALSGRYRWKTAKLLYRSGTGLYWTAMAASRDTAGAFYGISDTSKNYDPWFSYASLISEYDDQNGMSVRCVAR